MHLNRDVVVQTIVDAVMDRRLGDLSPAVADATRIRIADSIGCALSGRDTEAGTLTWSVATTAAGQRGRVVGRTQQTSLESAAFCDTAMIRCEDYNDSYNETGSGHPSDLIGTALALGGHAGVDGATLIAAVSGAYDALCGMYNHIRIGRVVWDQPTMVGPVAAALAGRLLSLDKRQVGHAVAMAAVSGLAVRQTRQGQLSVWKNLATAFASKGAVTAALLAGHGAEGPDQPYVGTRGAGKPLFSEPGDPVLPSGAIVKTNLKFIPCCYHGHTCVELAERAHGKLDVEKVSRIAVSMYDKAYTGLAAEPEKWRPTTAATADHSLPFLVASTLVDGEISHESFRDERLSSPELQALMDKVEAIEDPGMTAAFPDLAQTRMEIFYDGEIPVFSELVSHPKGHHKRPPSPDEVRAKFVAMGLRAAGGRDVRGELDATYSRLMALDDEPDVAAILDELSAYLVGGG